MKRRTTRTEKLWKKRIRYGIVGLFLSAMALCTTGCKTTELEDRIFPMLAAADYDKVSEEVGFTYVFPVLKAEPDAAQDAEDDEAPMTYEDNFRDAFEAYEDKLGKVSDYNHMKVFLLSESFMENTKDLHQMLDFFFEEETFPRNTYVCVTDDVGGVLNAQKSMATDCGTYIEDLLETHAKEYEVRLVTLGDLMDEKENQIRDWNIPYLTVEDETVVWSNIYR